MKDFIEQLKEDEGLRLLPYRCTAGKLTIGYGRNIEDNGIFLDEAVFMLERDSELARRDLIDIFNLRFGDKLYDYNRFNALTNMMYNLGKPRFLGFKKMIAAIKIQDWKTAADEMIDSKWAKQVGDRAVRLAAIIRGS